MSNVQRPTDKPQATVAAQPLQTPWDRRLTPDSALGARSPKVAALLARTAPEAAL